MRVYIIHTPLDWQVVGLGLIGASSCRVQCPVQPFGERNIIPVDVIKSETDKVPSSRCWGYAPVVVVMETIRYDLLEVHIEGGKGVWACRATVNPSFQI